MSNEAAPQDKKEIARDLRKKNKRLTEGRDALKVKNREKAKKVKKLLGNIDDLIESRDSSKKKAQEANKKNKELVEENKQNAKLLVTANSNIINMNEELLKTQKLCDELKKKMI